MYISILDDQYLINHSKADYQYYLNRTEDCKQLGVDCVLSNCRYVKEVVFVNSIKKLINEYCIPNNKSILYCYNRIREIIKDRCDVLSFLCYH